MKTNLRFAALAALSLAAFAPSSSAQLNIPSDGSDLALIVASNTVIDLSQAITGTWSSTVIPANAGKGIYDSNKWAVVFKYSSVTISNGATLTFANHPSRAPVVWLVSGDVTIEGTVSLDGQGYRLPPDLAEPGPGGFRGGFGALAAGVGQGAGFGPGGGRYNGDRAGGSYGTLGYLGERLYGNPSLLPLIGGSGGSGDLDNNSGSITDPQSGSGAGGGGAILIACAGNLDLSSGGMVRANGGQGGRGESARHSGSGSGGGIRLICNTITGTGMISAIGGDHYFGGLGRIRIEHVTASGNPLITPDPSVVPLQAGATPLIWLPTDGPTARIVSIGSTNAPADPRASFGTFGPDVALPQVSTTPVVVETTNAEDASVVTVRVTPRANGQYTETTATLTQIVSASPLVIRWTADVPVNAGYSAVQVKVVRP